MKKVFSGAAVLLLAIFNLHFNTAHAQGTAFTYQGRLDSSGSPANGSYDIAFTLYITNVTGSIFAGPVTNRAVGVTNGLFTTTVDFGLGAFLGASNWLQLAVSTNGANSFSSLAPRQQVTPTPYAIYSATANLANLAASASTAGSAASVPASGIGAGTANINITGNAATATSAATAGLAATATTASSATSATTAVTAGSAISATFAGTATNLLGILPDAQLSTNIARLNGTNLFTGTNTFASTVIATNPANVIYGTFTGSGAGLTGLSSVSLAAGSITAAMLAPDAVTMLGTPGSGPTNAVNVSSNGLVGIGTSNGVPTAGLQIASGANETTLPVLYEVKNYSGGYTNLANGLAVAVTNNLLAIGSLYGITLVNIANPNSPVILSQLVNGVGVYTNLYGVEALAWAGSNLVAGAYYSGAVTIISCTNPASPVKLAELRNGVGGWNYLSNVVSVAVSSNLLAIASYADNAVTLADISNPGAPVLKSTLINGTFGFNNLVGAYAVALSGNLLAIGAYSSSAITLVDVSNPASPVLKAQLVNGVGGYTNLIGANYVAFSTNNLLAIAAGSSSAVTLVDVSSPSSPVLKAQLVNGVGGYNLYNPLGEAFSGTRLAIAAQNSSTITLVDVSNPASPVLLATAKGGVNGVDFVVIPDCVAFAGNNLVTADNADSSYTILNPSTQAVGLDSANWVGIGTTQPKGALDVVGNVIVEGANLFNVNSTDVELGLDNVANGGAGAVALGNFTTASGYASTAMGFSTTASGLNSTAMGDTTTASGLNSAALGNGTIASGPASIAMGYQTQATNSYATALGFSTTAGGSAATAMGYQTQATGQNSTALGYTTIASGVNSTASGNATTASGGSSTAMGYNTIASGSASTALGDTTTASGNYSTAMGFDAQATNSGAFVWADSQFAYFSSTNNDSFNVRAQGGVHLVTSGAGLTVDGQPVMLTPPLGMALIPTGTFTMGDSLDGEGDATPTTNISVSAFYMDINLVSYAQWLSVYFWATNHGYGFVNAGAGKAANHPVQTVDWFDCVKWSNARSQQAGLTPVYYTDAGFTQIYTNGEVTPYQNLAANGYRLPTEAEWEKAARGGLSGQRFPWGNIITENLANYFGAPGSYSYDLGPNGYNTAFTNGTIYSSPVAYFAPNGYGLYDMAGNVFEWCGDWYGTPYGQPTPTNPTGPAAGIYRVSRGTSWGNFAPNARCASRNYGSPVGAINTIGFRCVRGH